MSLLFVTMEIITTIDYQVSKKHLLLLPNVKDMPIIEGSAQVLSRQDRLEETVRWTLSQ